MNIRLLTAYTIGMHYYEVLVAHLSYHGNEALTYESSASLTIGSVVRVSLRSRPVLGIVINEVGRPAFDVKPVSAATPYPPLPPEDLELLEWLRSYYPAPLGAIVRLFVPPTEVLPKAMEPPARVAFSPSNLPPLTDDQQRALKTIQGSGSFLLHGITGSGKSRVYLELARQAVETGRSAMVLTPEIGLTTQLTAGFIDHFGESRVHVLHSRQTAAGRRDSWYRILGASEPVIIIGPRSALFAPVRKLGLIVLDEAHDGAYKNESAPHYQAGRVAGKLAALHGATFVSGSATPSVEDYFIATEKHRPIVEMHELAKPSTSRLDVKMVDLRRPEEFSRSRLLSTPLLEHMTQALTAGEQSLLFLNRRGTANVVLCSQCGWQTTCPNCDLTLTYHGDEHRLRCHVCGYTSLLPTTCPVCGNDEILLKSIGTKAVLSEVQRLFPSARALRFDTDLKKAERLEQHLNTLVSGDADIIVGTQMVGKGLDLPKLSVVGILNADSSLLIPDYTAHERTYQLISQVAGRVGRGHRHGTVVVQTYDPENPTLHNALSRNWSTFYKDELTERQTYLFPPFTYLLKLRVLRASSAAAEKAATDFAATLRQRFPGLRIDGPAPSFHPKERGKYSWQLLLKASRRQLLTDIIAFLPSGWSYDIDPINLL